MIARFQLKLYKIEFLLLGILSSDTNWKWFIIFPIAFEIDMIEFW